MNSLDELEKKIHKLREESKEDDVAPAQGQKLGEAMHMATEFMAAVGVGGVMGFFIDRAAGTSPIFLLVFFMLGFAAGVRNMLRNVNK